MMSSIKVQLKFLDNVVFPVQHYLKAPKMFEIKFWFF